MEVPDKEIVSELKENSKHGFRHLFNKYTDYLYSDAFNVLEDEHEALTIANDTLMTAAKMIETFEFTGGENDFRNWLFTICRHKAYDVLSSKARAEEESVISLDATSFDQNGNKYNPAQVEIEKSIATEYGSETALQDNSELRKIVRGYLKGLPEKKRIVLECCSRGLPHKEVAKYLRIPHKNVTVYYGRYLEDLKQYLLSLKGK